MSPILARLALCVVSGTASLLIATGGARAQASGCDELQKYLLERKSIAEKLTASGKNKIDAKVACTGFGALVKNGETLVKWTDTNKEWCQIPESFVAGIKADHGKAQAIRTKACSVAAQQQKMEQQAKRNGGAQGGLLGGNGLSGGTAMPQGAL